MKQVLLVIACIIMISSCRSTDDSIEKKEFEILENRVDELEDNLLSRVLIKPAQYYLKHELLIYLNEIYCPIIEKAKDDLDDLKKDDLVEAINKINIVQKEYLNTYQFENNVILNLSKSDNTNLFLQIDSKQKIINLLLSDKIFLLNQILREKGTNDKIFNHYEPVIKENSNIIKCGQIYRAEIYIAAFDTTSNPSILIGENDSIPIMSGKGIYQRRANKPGKVEYEGTIKMYTDDGRIIKIPFKEDFMVVE